MKFFLILLILFVSSTVLAQNDSLRQDIELPIIQRVNSINSDSILMLKIFNDSFYEGKGFLIEDIPNEVVNCDSMNKKAIISNIGNQTFLIKYKFRGADKYIIDTCVVYSMNNSAFIALPIKNFPEHESDALKIFSSWLFIPASTDDREVVYVCREKEGTIVLFD